MLRFRRAIEIRAPLDRVFAFHLDTHNAARIAPPFPRVTVLQATTPPTAGQSVQLLRVDIGPIKMPWEALVTRIEPMTLVEDVQQRGPFTRFVHQHRFEVIDGQTTRLIDELECAFPWYLGGPLADLTVGRLLLSGMFAGRHRMTKRILEDFQEPVWITPSNEVDHVAARALGIDSTGRTRQTGFFPSVSVPTSVVR